jgi:hypothetical protein
MNKFRALLKRPGVEVDYFWKNKVLFKQLPAVG